LKRERWGSLLVQEKYREEKACDKRHPYRIITITIIIIIKLHSFLKSALYGGKWQASSPGHFA
jgi:hypothetical protein